MHSFQYSPDSSSIQSQSIVKFIYINFIREDMHIFIHSSFTITNPHEFITIGKDGDYMSLWKNEHRIMVFYQFMHNRT